jgi:hypothetical protein
MWDSLQPIEKSARRSVSRVLSRTRYAQGQIAGTGMAIHLGRPLPNASRDRPERRRGRPARQRQPKPTPSAAPTWSCSRWGLPCRRRCRRRGALLPHHFTLAARRPRAERVWRCVSVALSLGSPPPGVTRHRASVEPGLSSLRRANPTKSGHPTVWLGRFGMAGPAFQTVIGGRFQGGVGWNPRRNPVLRLI